MTDINLYAAAWERLKEQSPGTARRALDEIEVGVRAADALDDTLNGGHP